MKIPPVKVYFPEEDRRQILQRIDECLASGMVAQGKNLKEFEDTFCKYVDAKHAIAVSSGGSAIEIAMRALNVRDQEVLAPCNTFLATASSVLLANGAVRFVDVEADTLCVSLEGIKRQVTERTRGVIVVHIGGIITPDIEKIQTWCESNGLWLFEDCAHAHGSRLNGKMAGGFGVGGSYSFFATKVMTSSEGGMVVTNNDELAKKIRVLRDYGKADPWVSYHTELGANWRLSELSAIVGLVQLKRLDEFISWRESIADLYTKLLREIPQLTPVLPKGKSSWYKYMVLLPKGVDRDALKAQMKAQGVSLSGGVYDVPLHRQPIFANISNGHFPVADDVCNRHICLPLYYSMTHEEATYVVKTLKECLEMLERQPQGSRTVQTSTL